MDVQLRETVKEIIEVANCNALELWFIKDNYLTYRFAYLYGAEGSHISSQVLLDHKEGNNYKVAKCVESLYLTYHNKRINENPAFGLEVLAHRFALVVHHLFNSHAEFLIQQLKQYKDKQV